MANVHCILCGATGHSKNPATRTVFPDDLTEALLSHILKFPKMEDGWATGTIKLRCDSIEEYFTNLIGIVKMLEKVGVKQYACNHHWVLDDGQEPEC